MKVTLKNIKAVYKSLFLCFFINISFSQTLINYKLESRIKNITNAKNFKGVISSENVLKISNEFGLDNDQIIDVTAQNQKRPKDEKDRLTYEDKVQLSWDNSSAMLLLKWALSKKKKTSAQTCDIT